MGEEPTDREIENGAEKIVRPAGPEGAESESLWAKATRFRKRGEGLERLVMQFCAVLAVAVLVMAIIFFAGFAENDKGVIHLLSALAMSLGLAALAWFPLLFVFYYAWQRRKTGKKLHPLKGALTLAVLLPWTVAGIFLLPLGGLARMGGVLAVASSLFLSGWVIISLRKITAI